MGDYSADELGLTDPPDHRQEGPFRPCKWHSRGGPGLNSPDIFARPIPMYVHLYLYIWP